MNHHLDALCIHCGLRRLSRWLLGSHKTNRLVVPAASPKGLV